MRPSSICASVSFLPRTSVTFEGIGLNNWLAMVRSSSAEGCACTGAATIAVIQNDKACSLRMDIPFPRSGYCYCTTHPGNKLDRDQPKIVPSPAGRRRLFRSRARALRPFSVEAPDRMTLTRFGPILRFLAPYKARIAVALTALVVAAGAVLVL